MTNSHEELERALADAYLRGRKDGFERGWDAALDSAREWVRTARDGGAAEKRIIEHGTLPVAEHGT